MFSAQVLSGLEPSEFYANERNRQKLEDISSVSSAPRSHASLCERLAVSQTVYTRPFSKKRPNIRFKTRMKLCKTPEKGK